MKRRLLAFLLALSMMFSLVPVNAFAVGAGETEAAATTEAAQTETAETTVPAELPETEPAEPAVQTQAEEPDAEEDPVAPLADTEQEDILSDIGFVRAEGSAEKVPMDVDYFAATWTFRVSHDAQTQSFWAAFQYDPATTEFFYIRDPGLAVEDDTENGTLRIGGDGGEIYTGDYTFEIAFRPKAFGDATVTLKSFEVDGKDYLSAPIAVATTVCCSVSWDQDTAYTVAGDKLVEAGKDYTFTVAANEGYDASNAIVKVNGEEVTGVDGTYTVAKVSADLTITVEGVTEAVKQSGLSVLKFGDTSTESKAQMFQLIPAFDPAVKEYTVLVPDNAGNFFAWATRADDRSGSTTITAKWENLYVNKDSTQALTSGKAAGQNLAGFAPTGTKVNTMTIEVVDGDFTDTYKLTSVRVAPTLTALSLDGIRFTESFSAAKTAYTATTAAESVTVAATPRDESYTVTVNGGSETTVPLELGENKIEVVVTNPGGYTSTYTITVTRVASVEVVFDVDPADANVTVWDSNKDRVAPADGKYSVMSGAEYTYLVQRDGYVSQKSSFTFSESGSIVITLLQATENPNLDKSIVAEWGNFRNGDDNLGITDAKTPYAPEDAELLWAVKHGTGWAAAPGSPIMVDGDIYTYSGSTIRRINSMTGETVTEGTMVGSSSYSIVPMTYGDGMVFVGLSGGRIQAFNAKTLESLWVYTDDLGGQPNCPITYKDGYVYAGFWNGEDRDGNFACINTIDEDHASTTEAKYPTWTYTRQGGFYWAGAYVTDKLAIVGTDDGASGYNTNGAALLVFDRYTGELLDSHEGIRGDLRSNISHDPDSDRVFFTTKGGILGNAQIDWDTGKILDYKEAVIKNSKGTANAMSTCTPSVYNGRIYIGVSGDSQFGSGSGHGIAVYDLNSDGSMTQAYVYDIIGYPQTSAMVSTAYSAEDGYVYIYLPYNYTPGGISVLKDRPGQTKPLTTTDSGYSEVFTPVGSLAQYCICSTIADQYGTIYYKNDSCYMMAITSKIESLEITQEPTITENEDGTLTVDGLKAVTKLKNGLERDVSKYVSVTKNEQTGGYTVSYTYGFDNDSYGLKTVTAEIAGSGHSVTIPEDEGYTVTGEKTVKDGEDYTFTVTVAEGYDGTNMVVKVNGEEVTAVDGKYTVEKVSSDLTITVEGVTKKVTYTLNFEGMSGAAGNVAVGAAFEGVFSVTADSTVSYETFTATFKFDPAVVEVTYIRPAIFEQSVDTKNGILTLTSKNSSFPANRKGEIMIGFKSIAFGDATVSLNSVKTNDVEVLPEPIAVAQAVGYKVTWDKDANFQIAGEKYANVGGTYQFAVSARTGYDVSNVVVKVNGNVVTAADGIYTVENVSTDLEITVEGVQKAAVYTVGFAKPSAEADLLAKGDVYSGVVTITADRAASYKSLEMTFMYNPAACSFEKVSDGFTAKAVDAAYTLTVTSDNGSFKAGENKLAVSFRATGYGDAAILLTSVKIDGKELVNTELSVEKTVGYSVTWDKDANFQVAGEKLVAPGAKYQFAISPKTGYDASDAVVKVNGNVVTAADGIYTVENVSSDLEITVEGVQKAAVYTVGFAKPSAEADLLAKGDVYSGVVTITADRAASYKSLEMTFMYNPAACSFEKVSDGLTAKVDTANGTVTVTAGNGSFTAGANDLTASFRAAGYGDAAILLLSVKIDGKELVSGELSVERTVGYSVTWAEDAAYTVTGEKVVAPNADYSFTVAAKDGYDAAGMIVKVNGTEVTAADGKYTVAKVSSDLTITVEGVAKKTGYAISFEPLDAENVAVGSSFANVFTFGADSDVSFKTFRVTFRFDPAVVEYRLINPNGIGVEADNETGTLTLYDENFGFTGGERNSFQLIFGGKVFGDATVTLKSFEIDGENVLDKEVAVSKTVGYKVTWTEDETYTVTGEKYADVKGTYTFTVAAKDGYDASKAVVKVNGTEVTAVDGKYTVDKVTSDLTITVEGVKKVVTGLSALRFGSTGTISSAKYFDMSPSFSPEIKEYTLLIPDSTNGIYAWATRGNDLSTKASIKAEWTSMSTGKAGSTTLTSGTSTGKSLSGFNIASAESNTLTITVTDGDVKDVYTIKTVRIAPSLTKLALDGMKLNENFSATKKTYTATTAKDSVTILATPRGESYTVTYNGGTDNTIPLSAGENKIEIVVTNKDGYTNSYTLTVTKADHSVTLPTDESYTVTGQEAVMDGADYTFQVAIDYRYEADKDFAVKVNGETVTGENGKYTVKNVKTDLVITVEGVKWKVLEPVTVYFSFSHDENFKFCEQSGQTVALKEITVPYFDLALYGLEDFYFSSEDYGPASGDPTGGPGSALEPGTKEFAYGKVTMFHLFIYATEVYYLGVDPADAGKGYLKDNGLGTSIFNVTGSTGSTFLQEIWNYDLNLNYYLNYEYPLASAGWGSTSDQILLHDGDIVTLGHFSDWSFYQDSGAVFNHIETDITDPVQGDKVTMKIYRDGADMNGSYGTAHTLRTNCPDVYCTLANNVTTGDVTQWTKVGTADADGTLVVDTSSLAPGEYIFAIPGQYGNDYPNAIVGAPGGIRLTIHEKPAVKGDINGDGVLDVADINALYDAINNEKELDASVADVNGDGVIDVFDVMALYNTIQNDD